jgi:hypothetical protein
MSDAMKVLLLAALRVDGRVRTVPLPSVAFPLTALMGDVRGNSKVSSSACEGGKS